MHGRQAQQYHATTGPGGYDRIQQGFQLLPPPQPLRFALGLRSARLDELKAGIARERNGVEHIATAINPEVHDFCEDGFHPSAESCRLWAQELAASTELEAAIERKEHA